MSLHVQPKVQVERIVHAKVRGKMGTLFNRYVFEFVDEESTCAFGMQFHKFRSIFRAADFVSFPDPAEKRGLVYEIIREESVLEAKIKEAFSEVVFIPFQGAPIEDERPC